MSDAFERSVVAARFAHIEEAYDFRRVSDPEVVSIEELPVFIRLGHSAVTTLVILDRENDLTHTESHSSEAGRALSPEIDTFIINPEQYDLANSKGYKALRPNAKVTLGRQHRDLDRFDQLPQTVSRTHASIQRSEDGKTITITDHDSHNGTYLGRLPRASEETSPPTVDQEPLQPLSADRSSLASEMHPSWNEDSLVVDTDNNLFAVFDGVGGHEGGQLASNTAAEYISTHAEGNDSFTSMEAAEKYMRQLLVDANEAILEVDETRQAATTAVIAKVHQIDGESYVSVAHSGDSRAYLLRDGVLSFLTADHTPYRNARGTQQAMIRQEKFADTDMLEVLSDNSKQAFMQRNIIGACLGHTSEVRADVKHFPVIKGDKIILTSDGVHDNLQHIEMQKIMIDEAYDDFADALTAAANRRAKQREDGSHVRAKYDDITAVVINL